MNLLMKYRARTNLLKARVSPTHLPSCVTTIDSVSHHSIYSYNLEHINNVAVHRNESFLREVFGGGADVKSQR